MSTGPAPESVPTHSRGSFGWPLLSLTRFAIGWVFLWAFLDNLFGLA